jgi:hypothetical protein
VHLHRLDLLAPQVSNEEGLSGYIAVNEDCIVTDRVGQDMRDQVKDREKVLLKQEGHAREGELTRAQDVKRSDVQFRLVIYPFVML